MKGDVEIASVFGHVDQMAFRIDKEPSSARSDVLDGNPGGRHAADLLGIEIVGILMWPSNRVAIEIHALHELARLT
jgi:hypothetical protein